MKKLRTINDKSGIRNLSSSPIIHNSRQRGLAPRSSKSKVGQTMLLTVMLLSGAILSATSLAALLVLYQLRQATDAKASTQAIFAADSGIECVLFEQILSLTTGTSPEFIKCGIAPDKVVLDNLSYYTITVNIIAGDTVIKSVGVSGRTTRALEITF